MSDKSNELGIAHGVDECPYGLTKINPNGICGSCEFYDDCELEEE